VQTDAGLAVHDLRAKSVRRIGPGYECLIFGSSDVMTV
jgi:hypothetical protein